MLNIENKWMLYNVYCIEHANDVKITRKSKLLNYIIKKHFEVLKTK